MESLSIDQSNLKEDARSCSYEKVIMMGGTVEEASIAAGLAGGIGLSGKGCGALTAAILFKTLKKVREKGRVPYPDPTANKILEEFLKSTDYKFECSEICGKKFASVAEHTEYLKEGGCSKLLNTLAKS